MARVRRASQNSEVEALPALPVPAAKPARRKKVSAPPEKVTEHGAGSLPQLLLIGGLSGCALLTLALASYHPADGSLASGGADVHNRAGPIGAWLADSFYQAFGYGAWGVLLVAAVLGMQLAGRRTGGIWTWMLVGIGAMFSMAGMQLGMDAAGRDFPPGGVVGVLVAQLLKSSVGKVGAGLTVGAGLVAVATALFRINWQPFAARLLEGLETGTPKVARKLGEVGVGAVKATAAAGAQGALAIKQHLELRRQAAVQEEEEEEEEYQEEKELPEELPPEEVEPELVAEPTVLPMALSGVWSARAAPPAPPSPKMRDEVTEVAGRALVEVEWEPTSMAAPPSQDGVPRPIPPAFGMEGGLRKSREELRAELRAQRPIDLIPEATPAAEPERRWMPDPEEERASAVGLGLLPRRVLKAQQQSPRAPVAPVPPPARPSVPEAFRIEQPALIELPPSVHHDPPSVPAVHRERPPAPEALPPVVPLPAVAAPPVSVRVAPERPHPPEPSRPAETPAVRSMDASVRQAERPVHHDAHVADPAPRPDLSVWDNPEEDLPDPLPAFEPPRAILMPEEEPALRAPPRGKKAQILPGNLQSGGSNDDGRALRRADHFELPPLGLLDDHPAIIGGHDDLALQDMARKLTAKLRTYGVEGRVVAIRPGPVITVFEYEPAPGVKLSKISSLSDDLKMALEAVSVRIVAPIPGRGVVGVEIPNRSRQIVWARDVFASREFRESGHALPMILGKDTEGRPFVTDLAKMPHLLVGGTTGSGKSVGINAMLCSLLFTKPPEELRLILVDPKMLEFELYQEIPHLLHPVVTEAKLASAVLKWACVEMDERYRMLARWQTRNIEGYNGRATKEMEDWTPEKAKRFGLEEGALPRKLPYIVIVIDELADLMMVAAKDVEESIVRLAQKARAAGIHLIVATQRPSVDVITGLIKANMPSRLAYQVRSKTDGRTILDQNGAETLLGKGDLLFLPPGTSGLIRVHGPLLTDEEVRRVADFVRSQGTPEYAPKLTIEESDGEGEENLEEEMDENYDHAVSVAIELGRISTSMIQRRLKIGYNRAARIMEILEREGVVGPADGARPREVLLGKN